MDRFFVGFHTHRSLRNSDTSRVNDSASRISKRSFLKSWEVWFYFFSKNITFPSTFGEHHVILLMVQKSCTSWYGRLSINIPLFTRGFSTISGGCLGFMNHEVYVIHEWLPCILISTTCPEVARFGGWISSWGIVQFHKLVPQTWGLYISLYILQVLASCQSLKQTWRVIPPDEAEHRPCSANLTPTPSLIEWFESSPIHISPDKTGLAT